MSITYLLLGTNLGDKTQNLYTATQMLASQAGVVQKHSAIYETMPWGIPDQPVFYNQVLVIDTSLEVRELLRVTQSIEVAMGRQKYRKWGERLIDIDILYYGQMMLESEDLNVPHSQIALRRFTLTPLVEIAPLLVHPALRLTQTQLLAQCPDKLEVKKVKH
ncbi:2-amino-4-hydroxy-6-hydroxymethyldihydropteridine diphosphokinase [uncultured Microscilla sp.]|uniref:2-amino-4-hydroxy-6- hydroxymethyldihydropteridine diphosphokinase n=1 Tax=uncultured Microscilla sp. TaxID=432653 RepID=UPI00260C869D|nr:2-amino-4-hydroxy-6-hydroxymethyldihydropteridine diphosphokinase [uncultured Microscilla sp.]